MLIKKNRRRRRSNASVSMASAMMEKNSAIDAIVAGRENSATFRLTDPISTMGKESAGTKAKKTSNMPQEVADFKKTLSSQFKKNNKRMDQ
jgi:hypothetical protein